MGLQSTLAYSVLVIYGVAVIVAAVSYLPKLIQFFSMFYRPPHKKAEKLRKISLIVPARGESEVIGDLFASIEKQTYGKSFFDVNVIVNEEDDPTVEIAKKFGANVFVVKEQKCKGDALDGYFKALPQETFLSYDAFVIVDADAVLTPDYVTELNNALEYDRHIFITRKNIKNFLGDRSHRSIFCNCSALTYPQLDDLANNFRTKHGIPMNMCGQGMMIRREVIDQIGGWPYRTLTEDYELRMDCFLKGFTSMYYPYAVLYTEETVTHKDCYKRRLRWLIGFTQCQKMYKKAIKKQVKDRGKMNAGEFELFYSLVPPIIFIVATCFAILCGIILSVYFAMKGEPWLTTVLLLCVMPFGVIYLVAFIYGILCMISYRDAFKPLPFWEKIATLLYAPLFMLEYFPLYIHSRVSARKYQEWEPTKHVSL